MTANTLDPNKVHHSPTPFYTGKKKDGSPNAIFDSLNRVVCSFPDIQTNPNTGDTRTGSPYTLLAMDANAALFRSAPETFAALRALVDWGRQHTSPIDENSPHDLLVNACAIIEKVLGKSDTSFHKCPP